MVFGFTDYRELLKNELAERIKRNPAYSLRSMAIQVGIPASHLCNVIKGQKNLSFETAQKVAFKLGFKSKERDYFTLLVQYQSAKDPDVQSGLYERVQALNSKTQVSNLALDQFKFIAEWYHLAILEMLNQAQPFAYKSAAKKLGIQEAQVEAAILRLKRLGLVKQNSQGRWVKEPKHLRVVSHAQNSALRTYHEQMLNKATRALHTQNNTQKFVGSRTFAIDPNQLEAARSLIRDFLEKMALFFDKAPHKTKTYHLGLQLFDLTEGN